MVHKLHEKTDAQSLNSLTLTTHMRRAKAMGSFDKLRSGASARKRRHSLSGGMFSHASRAYGRHG